MKLVILMEVAVERAGRNPRGRDSQGRNSLSPGEESQREKLPR